MITFLEMKMTFGLNIFIKVIDIVTNQVDNRIEGIHKIVCSFLLYVKNWQQRKNRKFKNLPKYLILKYKEDLTTEFPIQIIYITNTLTEKIIKILSIKEFTELLLIKFDTISLSFTEVITALLFFLILLINATIQQRKLKIIKISKL